MTDLVIAIGLVLVLEGILYAGFPAAMKAFMRQALELPDHVLRMAGLFAALAGLVLVWMIRG